MSCRAETAGGLGFRYCPDALPRTADRIRAVLRARALDETTREPMREALGATTTNDGLLARASTDGIVGLVGRPARVFPMLGAIPASVAMEVTARGFLPLAVGGSLGPIAGFPDAFAPLDVGDVFMHRIGVALAGRVVQRATVAPPPIAGATIAINAVWSELPPANWIPPQLAQAPNIVALEPGMYAPRLATATIRQRDLAPQAALEKRLLLDASPGERRMRLSDRNGLTGGTTILLVDSGDNARLEAILVEQVDASSDPDEAAWIRLAHPLAWLHRKDARCAPATPQAPLATNQLGRGAIAGDRVAITSAPPGFTEASTVEIDDGAAPPEYHRVLLYAAASDANGFFRLPPIARVALVRLEVQHAGFTPAAPIVTLDYRGAMQRVTVPMQ